MNAVETTAPSQRARIDAAAGAADLTPEQARSFVHASVTMGNQGMVLTAAELSAGAGLTAGRIDFVEYRRRCRT
jgi:hypothetical protein